MREINFKQIRTFQNGARDSFEELCCQIFRRTFASELPQGSRFFRFRGSGGDGGVEAIWQLPDGEKWGIQAKYFDGLEQTQFIQMEDSISAAFMNHPTLSRFIFCIPFDPTGPRANGRRGRSQVQKLEEWVQQRLAILAEQGAHPRIEFWTESVLRDRLIEVDNGGGMRRYWFDREILTPQWFQQRLQEAEAQAGHRYSPALSIDVPAFDILEAFSCSDKWLHQAKEIQKYVVIEIKHWERDVSREQNLSGHLVEFVRIITDELSQLRGELNNLTCIDSQFNYTLCATLTNRLLGSIEEIEEQFLQEFLLEHGENADTPSFRQFQAEYMCEFPAAKIDSARDLIKCLYKLQEWLQGPETSLPRSSTMLLRGPAGVGKTHAIIDHAKYKNLQGQVSVVLFGEDFTGAEPWEVIASKLGFSGNISRDELWGMLNTVAEASGKYAIIYVDALNESQERERWKHAWLPGLRQQLAHFPWLKLCISCRDTYLNDVIDERGMWPEYIHNGFIGREFDAIQKFFEFYGIQSPTTPLLQKEFVNPLFLHLVCKGLKGAGMNEIPLGYIGFSDVVGLILEGINHRASKVYGFDERDNLIHTTINALANKMAELGARLIPREVAKSVIEQIFFTNDHSRSLLLLLEKEGVISFVEHRSRLLGPKEWFCRFTFERVADFMIAASIIEGITHEVSQISERLHFALKSDKDAEANRGLLEAMSIILPETFGIELVDLSNQISRYETMLPILYDGFQWRAIESFTEHTEELVQEGLSYHNSSIAAMQAIMNAAVVPNHPFNANFLDRLLRKTRMTTRDTFWCYILHEDYQTRGAGWRLLNWALKAELSFFGKETATNWAFTLAWFCASSDRRVRDRATKGLTRIFVSSPEIMRYVVIYFLNVDDDYVVERVCLAAYSAVMLLENDDVLGELSKSIYNKVFKDGKVPVNALIRDWLRLILEYAYHRGVLSEVQPNQFRPPYNSLWPIHWPTEEDIVELTQQTAFQRDMALGQGIGTDFARYKLKPRLLNEYDLKAAGITEEQVHRWFILSVSNLGYPGLDERCYKYDRYMISKFGGGRGKPIWAERLGKKYYWILLHRLGAIFADHIPKKVDRWNSGRNTKAAAIQGINFRDIDPTDLRAYSTQEKSSDKRWWKPVEYDFDQVSQVSHEEWIHQDDFPDITNSLRVTDGNGKEWIHLSLYYPIKGIVKDTTEDGYPYRYFTTMITSVFVPNRNMTKMKQAILLEEWYPDHSEYTPDNYRILLGEYPDSLTLNQTVETGDLFLENNIPGTKAQITTIDLLRGKNFEYDCSEEGEGDNLIVPSPNLIAYGGLKWDGHSSWINESREKEIICINGDTNGLLISHDLICSYMQQYSVTLVCMGFQEKIVVTNMTDDVPGFHEIRSVCKFNGRKVDLIHKFKSK
ncbi:hypothetical protein [Paenibacillus protaetiae]|uniref:ATP-binding protein n=1 Tax=Paenibacillus protaetiae TaxID=2509456 RepID=A0A4P6F9Y7_9BACL|nr:hypothetical protein [Paenibacillus protaetiae]QAY67308.1 hypothetical protein ET464_13765 [Paenibacillus protaetiae]